MIILLCRELDKFDERHPWVESDIFKADVPVEDVVKPPENFSRRYIARCDIISDEMREVAWDYHSQWIRRNCLHPMAPVKVVLSLTLMDTASIRPIGQLLVMEADTVAPVREYLTREPLAVSGSVSSWDLFEADVVDGEDSLRFPVREPLVFFGLYDLSHPECSLLNRPSDFDVGAIPDDREYIPGRTARSLAAKRAWINVTDPITRMERRQKLFHVAASPHMPTSDAGPQRDPNRFDLESKRTDEAGGHFYHRAHAAMDEETVGGRVSMLAVLRNISEQEPRITGDASRRGRSVGTFMLLNAASRSDAMKYLSDDPLMSTGAYIREKTIWAPSSLHDTDGLHHLMGRSYYAHEILQQFHFRDPEDLLALNPSDGDGLDERSLRLHEQIETKLPEHHRDNAEVLNYLVEKNISYRYSRLQEPEELYRSQIDEGAPESAAIDDFSAHLESDLMGNITENMLLRRGDWPNMFPNETFDQSTGTIYDW